MINFVGAGPGAPDLITVRGMRLLNKADAIVYAGSLVNPVLLEYAKPGCEVFNSAYMTLEEVLAVLLRVHRSGGMAVRLHTGDPCIYGAIREQMDALAAQGVPFEISPGVSSFCGAAAALKAEYTLPEVSQSVIITRMAGRTPVPERESIRSFAAHGASMVIFLSSGMTEGLERELIEGGYSSETPAAIVYKATWPDEKVVRCTVGTLHRSARENGIANLALITVGNFLGEDYALSKLYDAAFTTAFREGTIQMQVGVIVFSERGLRVGERVKTALEADGNRVELDRCEPGGLAAWTGGHFYDDALIFIGSCGIAVRAVAPLVCAKTSDPAVVVIDELGTYVISLLSGHIGGANALAAALAKQIGAVPVITTATDINGLTAIDTWAAERGLVIADPERIKKVSVKALSGEIVRLKSDFPAVGEPPEGFELCDDDPDVLITWHAGDEGAALRLVPPVVTLGIGCRRGTSFETIARVFVQTLARADCHPLAVKDVCSIDLKADEPGILEFCRSRGLPYRTFSAGELLTIPGEYTRSEFVRSVTGVDNVCERSAVRGSGGLLLTKKRAQSGVTMALAAAPYTVHFNQERIHEQIICRGHRSRRSWEYDASLPDRY